MSSLFLSLSPFFLSSFGLISILVIPFSLIFLLIHIVSSFDVLHSFVYIYIYTHIYISTYIYMLSFSFCMIDFL